MKPLDRINMVINDDKLSYFTKCNMANAIIIKEKLSIPTVDPLMPARGKRLPYNQAYMAAVQIFAISPQMCEGLTMSDIEIMERGSKAAFEIWVRVNKRQLLDIKIVH